MFIFAHMFQVSYSATASNQGLSILPHLDWKYEVPIGKSESRMTSFEDEDEGPEIIDLQPALAAQTFKNVSTLKEQIQLF